MGLKRPKKLYQFDFHMNLDVHGIGKDCVPQFVETNQHGDRWRCRSENHDFYGYDERKAAKSQEIYDTKSVISERKAWLIKLLGGFNETPDPGEEGLASHDRRQIKHFRKFLKIFPLYKGEMVKRPFWRKYLGLDMAEDRGPDPQTGKTGPA